MPILSEGSAYLDRSGRVLAADPTFRALLGLPQGDATDALRARAAELPVLSLLLSGEGPELVRLDAGTGMSTCDLRRRLDGGGMLLQASPADVALPAPVLELAMQAVALARLAGSVAHDVKNPLNAMALQLALLTDKVSTASAPIAAACASNLASLKNQIGRVNDVVRRYLEVADPNPATGFDAGALLADAAALFAHEARRRRIVLESDVAPATVRAAGDPVRIARLLLGLLSTAIAGTPEGGRVHVRAAASGAEVVIAVEHARGEPDGPPAWVGGVVAAGVRDLGGRVDVSDDAARTRVAIVLPREEPL